MIDVCAVNVIAGVVLLEDDTTIPITNYFAGGEDCEPAEADTVVAGPSKYGWFTITLSNFDRQRTS